MARKEKYVQTNDCSLKRVRSFSPSVVADVGVGGGDLEQDGADSRVLRRGDGVGAGDDGIVVVDVGEGHGDGGGGGVLSGVRALVRGHHTQHVAAATGWRFKSKTAVVLKAQRVIVMKLQRF